MKIFFSFLFLFAASFVFPQKYPNERIHELIQKGINSLSEENFHSAQNTFEKLRDEFPQLPIGNIYLAATEISLSYDFGFPYNHKLITEKFNLAQKLLENENYSMPDIWKNYFWATLKTYKAYYYYLTDDWISAFTAGLSALSYLEDCIELDNNFYEAKMGLGIYKYWKSNKTAWIPFFSNEKNEGIAMIKESADKMNYNKALALHSLFWIYLEEKKYPSAVEVAKKGTELYYKSSYAFFMYARSLEANDKTSAIINYKKSLQLLQTKAIKSNYRTIFVKYKLAQLNFDLKDRTEAKKYLNEILAVKDLSEYEKKLLAKILAKVGDLHLQLK